jgi:hypothetical protein
MMMGSLPKKAAMTRFCSNMSMLYRLSYSTDALAGFEPATVVVATAFIANKGGDKIE